MGGASTFVSCTDHESDNAYNASISIADAVAKQLDALKLANQQLQANIDDLKSDVATNKDKIAALEAQVAANKAAIENLNGTWTEKFQKLNTQLNESIGALGDRATALEEAVNKINGQLPTELAKLNQAIQDIAELKTKSKEVDELQKKLDELNEKLYGKLAGEGDISTLKDAIDIINDKLKTMSEQLDAIYAILNNNVSGIVILATDCPVTGYENAAFLGSQANILSAYWGVPASGDEDFEVKGGKLIKSDAGNVYININPANVDPSNITFRLVDSQGNDAPGFKLGAPVVTDKVLKYGITRATSANGFYAIPVECTDPQNDGLDMNKGQLKEAAKNVLAKLQDP